MLDRDDAASRQLAHDAVLYELRYLRERASFIGRSTAAGPCVARPSVPSMLAKQDAIAWAEAQRLLGVALLAIEMATAKRVEQATTVPDGPRAKRKAARR